MTRNRTIAVAPLLVALVLVLGSVAAWAETTVLDSGTAMTYRVNSSDPGVDTEWFLPGFVEGPDWEAGIYGVGFDDLPTGPNALELIDTLVPGPAESIYTRATFTVADTSQLFSLHFGADYDDGMAVWINGVEVYRSPELRGRLLAWNTISLDHESSNGSEPDPTPLRDISQLGIPALVNGVNVIAIGVWNATAASEDLVLAPTAIVNRMLTRGPYLQQGGADRVSVRWRTGAPNGSRVLYGADPADLQQEEFVAPPTLDHTVTLTGLDPGSRYYYAIGTADEILSGGDEQHFFDTPPVTGTPKPTRIWALGDSGWGNGPAVAVRDAYYDFAADDAHGGADPRDTDLVLMLGDNAYPNGSVLDYQYNLFDIFQEQLKKSVVWPTIGNHDSFDTGQAVWPYYDLFTLPEQAESGGIASGTEEYYSFDYANLHFVVLNSMLVTTNGFGDAMLTWLETDLADVEEDWLVVFFHHPPYSKGSHDSDNPEDSQGRLVWMRENVVPILEDYGVDLVLTGHSHSYERSYLIDGHYGDSSSFDESMKKDPGDGNESGDGAYVKPYRGAVPYGAGGDGAVYAVAGSSSQLTQGKAEDLGGGEPNHPAMFVSMLELGSMVLDVDGNRLDGKFLDDAGVVADGFTIFKGAPTQAPLVDFDASARIVLLPASVDFVDQSSNEPTVWGWDFSDDGIVDSQRSTASHQFTETGLHSVRLSVANSAGADELLREGYICAVSGAPAAVEGLRFSPDPDRLIWNAAAHATAYDVVRGNLSALVAGDTTSIAAICLENDDDDLQADDPMIPPAGEVLFYVTAGANCTGEQGTFAGGGSGPSVPRDLWMQPLCASCSTGADDDADTVCGADDNCPGVPNDGQQDDDTDGAGNACDGCPSDPEKIEPGWCGCGVADLDGDADQTPDCLDGCPSDPEKIDPGQCGCGVADVDGDGDQTADCLDGCPEDPSKIDPGACGCGVADTDSDQDQTPDCNDDCPTDAAKTMPGQCGCGIADTDSDDDATADCNDGCPTDPAKTMPGQCGCGIADTDSDDDATADCVDGCPFDPGKQAPGLCGCGVPDTDSDSDGTPNCLDECPNDPLKIVAGVCGCGVADNDNDLDGTLDCEDGCPADPDKIEPGLCGCGVGQCWAVLATDSTRDLNAVEFPSGNQIGYAVGEGGTILKTEDGGLDWVPLASGTIDDLHSIVCPSHDEICLAAGDSGTLLRTVDGGRNWTPLDSGSSRSLRGIEFITAKVGYVAGANGAILRTLNQGDDWAALSSGTSLVLEALDFPGNSSVGYVVGRGGTILKTSNGGANWSSLISPTTEKLMDVQFPVDKLTGYVVGENGTVLKTTTAGFAWLTLDPATTKDLRGIDFPVDDLHGLVVGDSGVIRRTDDGGQSWSVDAPLTNQDLNDVQFPVDLTTGFAVGTDGTILKWVTE